MGFPSNTRRLLAFAGLAAAGLATAGAFPSSGARPSVAATAMHVLGGLSFILVGLLTWSRRPENRTGALITAVGFAWFASDLRWTTSSVALTVADLTDTVYLALLGHLVLAFPSGRLRTPGDRVMVLGLYVWVVLSSLVTHLLWAPARAVCQCPTDLLVLHRDPRLNELSGHVQNGVNISLTLAVLCLFIRHWSASTPLGRRALGPLLWASGPVVLAVLALNAVNIVEPLHGLSTVLPVATPLGLMTLPFTFLAGQIRSSIARLAVGELVVELGDTPPAPRLRDALARTLRDPSLMLAYWAPGVGAYVDSEGRTVELPGPGSRRGVTLLESEGEPVAALVHDASLTHEPKLVQSVSAVARLAVQNERLHAQVRAQLEEVKASRSRIVEAGDRARHRVQRDLHDGAQQRLVGLSLTLGSLRQRMAESAGPGVASALEEASEQVRCALEELRQLAAGIHPSVLTDDGLGPAIESLAERAAIPVHVSYGLEERAPPAVEAATYYVISEALANSAKHARATSVRVDVHRRDHRVVVAVSDDGVGGADASDGTGLRGLSDRLAAVGGHLTVISPPGRGTRVVADVPCPGPGKPEP